MSGRLKKIIWLILMAELVMIHVAVLAKLYLHKENMIILIILGIFIIGAVVASAFQYIGYRLFIKKCSQNIGLLEDEEVEKLFLDVLAETGASTRKARVYESSTMTNPFVMGIIRPAVILPASCRTHTDIRTILLHECFHIKRLDTQYKFIMIVSNCLLWFNPLAYFIRHISYQDIEISCDEAVLNKKSEEERVAYGQFLIDSARNTVTKENVFNAYWNSDKKILKNRIDAVVNENKRWDVFAKVAIIIIVLETLVCGIFFSKSIWDEYSKMSAPVNEYEDVTAPPIYEDQVIQEMAKLTPLNQDSYGPDMIDKNDRLYPEKTYEEIEAKTDSPWQIKVKRPGMFGDAADVAIQRLYYYLEDQTAFNTEMYELSPYQISYDCVYRVLLAGEIENSVWGYIWKVYCSDTEAAESIKKGYAVTREGEDNYLYFTTAVQIKMREPYIFEVVGYADLYQTLDAYEQKYSIDPYSYVPKIETPVVVEERDLSTQKLLADAFAETMNMWDVMISFPENDMEGYMLAVADKAMMEVYCVLYKTTDGGENWVKVDMDSTGTEHSVTYEFSFINDNEGYMAIHSFFSNPPCMLRTTDAGLTWEYVSFSEEIVDFCQTHTPVWNGEKYIVYVGKEESSKNKGEKACYETNDGGKSWNYTGQVTFE